MNGIREGRIAMRAKAVFAFTKAAYAASIVLAWAAAVYFMSLVFFKFNLYDPFGYLSLGRLGLQVFYVALPWRAMTLFVGFIAIAMLLLRDINWAKRPNVSGTAMALAVLVIAGGAAINAMGVNQAMWNRHAIPYLYHGNFIGDYWVMGHVTTIDLAARTMSVLTPNGEPANVQWDSETELPQGDGFRAGDMVQVVGDMTDGVYLAEGIVIVSKTQ